MIGSWWSNVQEGFSPRNIPGLVVWLDALNKGSITPAPSSGSTVTGWADQSGNGNNATGHNLLYQTNVIHGRPAMNTVTPGGADTSYFGGGISPTITSASMECIMVFTTTAFTNGSRVLAFGLLGTSALANPLYWLAGVVVSSGVLSAYRNSTGLANYTLVNGTAVVADVNFDGSNNNNNFYINGTATGTSPASFTSSALSVSSYSVSADMNQRTINATSFTGYIGEYIVFNTVLTTAQRSQLTAYLRAKWGI